jgi:hypothetical protein
MEFDSFLVFDYALSRNYRHFPLQVSTQIAFDSFDLRHSRRRVAHPLRRFSFPVPEPWVPRPCVLGKGGCDAACTIWFVMPVGLHRTYGAHHPHFITCPCYRRLPFLRGARARDLWTTIRIARAPYLGLLEGSAFPALWSQA